VLAEFDARAGGYSGTLASIYLGGGTPSLWDPACIADVVAHVTRRFGTPREVTIEANPTDITRGALDAWHAAGIDRLSIGVQSFVPDELVMLGRDHRFGDGADAIHAACADGRFVVSADFILGVPTAKREQTLERIAALPVDHLSIYELTIEDRTQFGKRAREGKLVPLDEDTLTDLYTTTHDALVAAGFEHYEISSYGKRRAVHNSLYWQGAAYLGLGVGAASLQLDGGAVRRTNPRRAADYFAGAAPDEAPVSDEEMATDRAWLGLRTSDGVTTDMLRPAVGVADWLVTERLAERRGDRICPTLRGFLYADRVAARIVQSWRRGDTVA
jgi:coproporphyrinogen III oxidase-like Fe-S oxidoreductase